MAESPNQYLFTEEVYALPSRCIVVINRDWNALGDAEKATLSNIMNAVRLGLPGVQLISRSELDVNELTVLGPDKLIIFGASVKSSPAPYVYHQQHEGVPLILCDSLETLNREPEKKKLLWDQLRKMFNI